MINNTYTSWYNTHVDDIVKYNTFQSTNNTFPNKLQNSNHITHIYVDGSYMASINKCSYAAVFVIKGHQIDYIQGAEFDSCGYGAIAGEWKAITNAIQYSYNKGWMNIVIHSDCRSIVDVISGISTKNFKGVTFEHMLQIEEFRLAGMTINCKYVSGHTGHIHNEMADTLAKSALTM